MACGVRCVVCGVSCVVCGVWCMVCGVRCVVCGVWCVVSGVWCLVCGVCCVLCGVWCNRWRPLGPFSLGNVAFGGPRAAFIGQRSVFGQISDSVVKRNVLVLGSGSRFSLENVAFGSLWDRIR